MASFKLPERLNLATHGSFKGAAQLLWSFTDVLGSKVIILVTFLLLASFLDPKDFGAVAIATAIIGALIATMDASFGGALIQRQHADDDYFNTGFTLSSLIGLVLAALLVLGGIVAKYRFQADEYFYIFCGLSPVILLHCLTVAHQSYLVRGNRLGVLARARLLSIVVGAAAALGYAYVDASYWVLVIHQFITILTFTVAVWLMTAWRPRVAVRWAAMADIFRFTKYFWGWGAVNALEKNVDLWIIGAVLGPAAVGFYTTTQRLSAIIYEVTSGPVIRLILPAYSRLQEDHRALRERILAVNAATTIATMPIFVGFGFLAADVVALLLAPRWSPVGDLLPLFAAAMFFYASTMYDYQLLTATDRPDTVLKLSTIGLILLGLAIACGIPFGLIGVACAVLVRTVIVKFLVFRAVQRRIGLRTMPYLRSLAPAATASAVMFLGLIAFKYLDLAPAELPWRVAVTVLFGAFLYAACVLVFFRKAIMEAKQVLLPGARTQDAGTVGMAPGVQTG